MHRGRFVKFRVVDVFATAQKSTDCTAGAICEVSKFPSVSCHKNYEVTDDEERRCLQFNLSSHVLARGSIEPHNDSQGSPSSPSDPGPPPYGLE